MPLLTPVSRRTVIAGAAAAAAAGIASPRIARAATKLRVGKSVPHAFSFTPLDVGMEKGFFSRQGLDIEEIDFAGSAKIQQGLVADAVDISLGAGTDMAFVAKGVPATCVACMAGPPLLLGIIVLYDSPIKKIDDMRGKRISCSTVGSLTEWMGKELARVKGWGPDGITSIATGGEMSSEISALRTNQVDAVMDACAIAFQLEQKKEARLLAPVADYVGDFIIHGIYATNKIIGQDPETVRRFLKGWFDTIAFMRANKAETVPIVRKATGFDQVIEEREYDLVMPMFSADGKFPAAGLAKVSRSFVDLKILDKEPDMTKLYTEQFLPRA